MEQFVHHWHRSIHSSKKQNEKSPLLIWTSDFLLTVRKATKFLHFADGCAAAHTPGSRLFPGMTAFFSASCWDPFQSHKKMLWGMPTPAASITCNWPMGVHPWKHVVITSASSDAEILFPLFPTCSVAFFFFFFYTRVSFPPFWQRTKGSRMTATNYCPASLAPTEASEPRPSSLCTSYRRFC